MDAQPLVVSGIQITAGQYQGPHDVVYVVTGGNSVYAIDVHSGTVLLNPNLGKPVPNPLGCYNNGPNVGITSTPVIDPKTSTMYVMAYTRTKSGPAYYLHAPGSGQLDRQGDAPIGECIAYTHRRDYLHVQRHLPASTTGTLARQRQHLCGLWQLLRSILQMSREDGCWDGSTGTLAPLPSNQLLDRQSTSPDTFFLSAIWMSGYGAADDAGNILFVTGNSDYSGTTYDGVTNIQESVVKVSPDLATVLSFSLRAIRDNWIPSM